MTHWYRHPDGYYLFLHDGRWVRWDELPEWRKEQLRVDGQATTKKAEPLSEPG